MEWWWWDLVLWWISWTGQFQYWIEWDLRWWDTIRVFLDGQCRMGHILSRGSRLWSSAPLSYGCLEQCNPALPYHRLCLESECWMDRIRQWWDRYRLWCLLQPEYRQSRVMGMESYSRLGTILVWTHGRYSPDCYHCSRSTRWYPYQLRLQDRHRGEYCWFSCLLCCQ